MNLYQQKELLEALQDAISSDRWSSVVSISDILMELYHQQDLSQLD